MSVKRYRKKPVVIEAMQWDGTAEGATPIINWVLRNGGSARYSCVMKCTKLHYLAIETREGVMRASAGDWVIREPFPTGDRKFYPCKADIFADAYESADQ